MSKAFSVCVVGLLLAVGMAAGESFSLIVEPSSGPGVAKTPPLAVPEYLPPTPIPVDPGDSRLVVEPASPGSRPCPAELAPDAGPPGILIGGVDYVLWGFPLVRNHNKGRTAEISIPGGAVNTRTAASFQEDELHRFVSVGRFKLGYWMVEPNPWVRNGIRNFGVETTFFVAGNQSSEFIDESSPTILRPYTDLNNTRASALVVALPGLASGSFDVTATRKDLWGGEVNMIKNIDYSYPGTFCSLDLLAGVRFLSLSQALEFHRRSVFQNDISRFPAFQALGLAGNTLEDSDSFLVHNYFLGGQVGISGKFYYENFTLDGTFKLGLGGTSQRYVVRGSQIRTLADGTQIYTPAGLFAVPSNSGRFRRTRFSEVAEAGLEGRWAITECLGLRLGFTALRWNRMAYPGDQVAVGVDISQVPNHPDAANAPRVHPSQVDVPLKSSSFWLMGINGGIELMW